LFQIVRRQKIVYQRTRAIAAALILGALQGLCLFAESSASYPAPTSTADGGAAGASAAAPGGQAATPAYGADELIDVSIRFFDKRVYYPESPIPLKITITNKSASTYRFKLAEDRVYSLAFEAKTPSNRSLEPADGYKKALATTRPVFYREMAVEPGEEYSFVEDLARFIRIPDAGSYSIRADFFPELATDRSGAVKSNVLILPVRPSLGLPPASDIVSAETGEVLSPKPLPPDEVVRGTIVARQRSQWNEFFLYLDLEALLSRNEARKRAYDRESDSGRRRMLEKYKADLRQNLIDVDIVTVPSSFEILETRYTNASGVVRVLEKFDYHGFRLVKEYDYELSRKDDIWYIEGYEVLNKGTE
jgi:hypothetical protein